VLFVLIEKIIENSLVEHGDSLEIISRPRLVTHDLINESVRLVGEIGDVLLTRELLLHIS